MEYFVVEQVVCSELFFLKLSHMSPIVITSLRENVTNLKEKITKQTIDSPCTINLVWTLDHYTLQGGPHHHP
jgi:hypothetical protein